MNEPSVPGGYNVVDVNVDVLVPFGSTTLEGVCVGCGSEASGLSERMEPTEITEGVFERFGETMWSSPLQDNMRVAMR